jgi:hypothetical protein
MMPSSTTRRAAAPLALLAAAVAAAVPGARPAAAQAPAAARAAAPTLRIPNESYTLPNGLRVILAPDRSTPQVTVDVWYHVGSKNEAPGARASRTCSST